MAPTSQKQNQEECFFTFEVKFLIKNAMVAAVYAALTLALAPISYGMMQVRVSEFMTLLAFVDSKYVPGLVLGCFLANIGSPLGAVDMAAGTFATFLAVYGMRFCPNIYVASLLPTLSNGLIIAIELQFLELLPAGTALYAAMAYIAVGEFISVSVVGVILTKLLLKNQRLQSFLLY